MQQNFKTLGHSIAIQPDRTSIAAEKLTPLYKSPVTDPVVTFDNSIKLLDRLIISPVITAIASENGLQTANARLFGTYPSEDPEGFRDNFYLRASIEQDLERGFLIVEQENGHYTAGMIVCPMAFQFPVETGSEWMISEVYISDGTNYTTLPVSSEDHATLEAVTDISTLLTSTNRTIRQIGHKSEQEKQDAWDQAKRLFTTQAVDIIERHGLLERPEQPSPVMV